MIIGIDLGTTNSCVAIPEGLGTKVLVNSEGSRTTPSIVAFSSVGELLVGESAKRQMVTNPKGTIFSAKRLIGRRFGDREVVRWRETSPFDIVESPNGQAWVKDGAGKSYSPEQIGSFVLQKMVETAKAYVQREVTRAVITVPAYFDDTQRQATRDAGRLAGLTVDRIINEPTAAALAYGEDCKKAGTVAVFDLGGGTFDVSILSLGKDGVFEVKATNGDTFLGGVDFDAVLVDWIVGEFLKKEKIDLRTDLAAMQRVREAAEQAKCQLSNAQRTEINLPYIAAGPKHLTMPITRSQFETLTKPLIDRAMVPCQAALRDARLSPKEVGEVVLVGGMTRMPRVIEAVREFFGRDPFRGVNPDEVVAVGAAMEAGVLAGRTSKHVLLDVCPISLGIGVSGGGFSRIIPRNTTVPVKKSQIFTTTTDGQTSVKIPIFQGEREFTDGNKQLGEFTLVGIPWAPRGVPHIEVTLELNAESILKVSAKDVNSGRAQEIEIRNHGGLTEEQIAKMLEDAKAFEKADRERKLALEKRDEVERYVNGLESQIGEFETKIPVAILSRIRQLIPVVREPGTANPAEIAANFQELKRVVLEMYAALSEQNKTPEK